MLSFLNNSKSFGKCIILFIFLFIITINYVSALRFVQTDGFNEAFVYGDDGIKNFIRMSDNLVIDVYVDSNQMPETNQIRIGEIPFDSCTSDVSGYYLCTAFADNYNPRSRFAPLQGVISLYDDPNSDNPIDTKSFSAKIDFTNPTISNIVVGGSSKGISVSFRAEDGESGIKEIRIIRGTISNPIPIPGGIINDFQIDSETGTYPQIVDRFLDEPLELEVPDGDHTIFIIAKDAFGNEYVSAPQRITALSTNPQIKDWHINKCDYFDENYKLEGIGPQGAEVCVYVEVDRRPNFHWNLAGSFTNFDVYSPSRVDVTRDVDIRPNQCFQHSDTFLCKISQYDDDDNSPIIIRGSTGGQHNFFAHFSFTDDFENTGEHQTSKSVRVIDGKPVINRLYSLTSHGDINYISSDLANIRVDFSSVAPVSPENAIIDAYHIDGPSSVPADSCTTSSCVWQITPSNTKFKDGHIVLLSVTDDYGNSADISGYYSEFVVNDAIPELSYIMVQSKERGGDPSLNWSKNCTSPAEDALECSKCIKGSSGCDSSFWDNKDDFFLDDSAFSIDLIFSAGVDPHVQIELFENAQDSSNFSMTCEEFEYDISDEDDDSNYFICSNSGVPVPKRNMFNLHFSDVGGISQTYTIPMITYEDGGEKRIWGEVNHLSSSPDRINRKFMSIISIRKTSILRFVPADSGTTLLDVESLSCYIYTDKDDVGIMGLVDSSFGYVRNNEFYLTTPLRVGSVEDDHLVDGFARMNCSLEVSGERMGVVYRSTENVTFPVGFYDAAWNQPSQEAQDEIEAILDNWEFYNDYFADIARIIGVMDTACTGYYMAASTIIPALALVSDLYGAIGEIIGGGNALRAPISGILTGTSRVFEILGTVMGPVCDIIQCRWCSGQDPVAGLGDRDDIHDISSDGILGEGSFIENNFLCGDDGFMRIWLEEAMPRVQNVEKAILEVLDGRLDSSFTIGDEEITDGFSWAGDQIGLDYALDTDSSWYMAVLTLCPSGILNAIERKRQIDCRYINCLENDVSSGRSSVNDCKLTRGYEMCAHVMGGIWAIIPLTGILDVISGLYEDFMVSPDSLGVGMAGSIVCTFPCYFGGGAPICGPCQTIRNLFGTLGKVTEFYQYLVQGFENSFVPENFCGDIDGMEPRWDRIEDLGW